MDELQRFFSLGQDRAMRGEHRALVDPPESDDHYRAYLAGWDSVPGNLRKKAPATGPIPTELLERLAAMTNPQEQDVGEIHCARIRRQAWEYIDAMRELAFAKRHFEAASAKLKDKLPRGHQALVTCGTNRYIVRHDEHGDLSYDFVKPSEASNA